MYCCLLVLLLFTYLDEAARRRFVKRLYIPLPDDVARCKIVLTNLQRSGENYHLSDSEISTISAMTDGYSGADMFNLCREAAMMPLREMMIQQRQKGTVGFTKNDVRPLCFNDFKDALNQVRASVSSKDLQQLMDWNSLYGSFGAPQK